MPRFLLTVPTGARAEKSPRVAGDGAVSATLVFRKLGAREFRAKKHVINDCRASSSRAGEAGPSRFSPAWQSARCSPDSAAAGTWTSLSVRNSRP